MKRSLLMSGAALALVLGLTPALAQDRNDSKTKHDQATSEQRHDVGAQPHAQKAEDHKNRSAKQKADERQHSRQAEQNSSGKGTTGSNATESKERAETAKPENRNQAGASNSDKAKNADKWSAESKSSADKKGSSPSSNTAAEKPNAETPSKSAEQNKSSPANDQNSTKTNDLNRDAARANGDAKPKVRATASLNPQKKTELHSAIAKIDVKPVTHVNFSVSVGTAVPRTVSLRPLPSTIVAIVPQYRGYDFFVARDEVIIVAPRTHKIVDVIERSGPSRARAESTSKDHLKLSEHQREIIRKHASSNRTVTTGSVPRTQSEIVVGETLPETVEVESFPDVVYQEVPEIRTYRYIDRGGDVYLVDPSDRRVIEEIR